MHNDLGGLEEAQHCLVLALAIYISKCGQDNVNVLEVTEESISATTEKGDSRGS